MDQVSAHIFVTYPLEKLLLLQAKTKDTFEMARCPIPFKNETLHRGICSNILTPAFGVQCACVWVKSFCPQVTRMAHRCLRKTQHDQLAGDFK
jgi:hypothetical protein